jgi:hypothetical protein
MALMVVKAANSSARHGALLAVIPPRVARLPAMRYIQTIV